MNGTKGDMYHKVILDRILQEGTLDHNPRTHYEDFYENATYGKEKNIRCGRENLSGIDLFVFVYADFNPGSPFF